MKTLRSPCEGAYPAMPEEPPSLSEDLDGDCGLFAVFQGGEYGQDPLQDCAGKPRRGDGLPVDLQPDGRVMEDAVGRGFPPAHNLPGQIVTDRVAASAAVQGRQLEGPLQHRIRHPFDMHVVTDLEVGDALLQAGCEKLKSVKEFILLVPVPEADNLRKGLLLS